MEHALGHSFANVRVHQGQEAPSIGALAFARGSHLHFAPGQYRPHSAAGQRILAHELAHVVQQREGRVAHPGGAVPINDDARLEAQADAAAARAPGAGAPSASAPSAPIQRSAATGTGPVQRVRVKQVPKRRLDAGHTEVIVGPALPHALMPGIAPSPTGSGRQGTRAPRTESGLALPVSMDDLATPSSMVHGGGGEHAMPTSLDDLATPSPMVHGGGGEHAMPTSLDDLAGPSSMVHGGGGEHAMPASMDPVSAPGPMPGSREAFYETESDSDADDPEHVSVQLSEAGKGGTGEFDGMRVNRRKIYEDKKAGVLDPLHPMAFSKKRGKKVSELTDDERADDWAEEQIHNKTVNRFTHLATATGTEAPRKSGRPVPSLAEVKAMNRIKFRLEAPTHPTLKRAVRDQIDRLKVNPLTSGLTITTGFDAPPAKVAPEDDPKSAFYKPGKKK
jgi:hypothetical protein